MADLAFVLVNKGKLPPAAKVIARANDLGLVLAKGGKKNDEMLTLELKGGGTVIAALMPAPHPDAPHMSTGPTSLIAEEAAAAPAHVIVTALGLEGSPEKRDLTMAALTAAVIDTTDAVGAMLAHGLVFHKAKLFSAMAEEGTKRGALPPEIAVDITAAQENEERMSFLTSGMERYGREEFYVTCPISGRGVIAGRAHAALGQTGEALSLCGRALVLQERAPLGPERVYEWDALRCIGEARVSQGRSGEALAPLERGLLLARRVYASDLPHTRFALARALVEVRGDATRALQLATSARDELKRAARTGEGVEGIDRWITSRERAEKQ